MASRLTAGWGAAAEMFVLTLKLAARPTQVFYERLNGDARTMKMKDGSTHLAPHSLRKTGAKNAIDLETGAILAAEITPANRADSATVSTRSMSPSPP